MPGMSFQEAYSLAASEHRAGRLDSARQIYEQLLAHQPSHIDTLMAAAQLNHQMGRADQSIEYVRRALAAAPDRPDLLANLGMLQAMTGCLDDAITTLRRVIALNQNQPEAYNNLGNVLRSKNDISGAIAAYQMALKLAPNFVDAQTNLGLSLWAAGDQHAAVAALERALQLAPSGVEVMVGLADALRHTGRAREGIPLLHAAIALRPAGAYILGLLGQLLVNVGDVHAAIEAYEKAVALNPQDAETISYMSVALVLSGDFENALRAAERAVQLKPDSGTTQINLGHALDKLGRFDEAIVAYRQSLQHAPGYLEPAINIALSLWDSGRFEAALAEMKKAAAISPEFHEVKASLGMMMLTLADFEKGWEVYDARRDVTPSGLDAQNAKPRWNGSDPAGKVIAIESEQGFGDTIQFARYIPLLVARGARVITHTPAPLARLIKTVDGVSDICIDDQPFSNFDMYTLMMSLPKFFTNDIATIPANVPYVSADPQRVADFRDRMATQPVGLKVGLSWAGRPTHKNDRERSIKLQQLAPLAQVPGVQFFSLQKGEPRLQAQSPLGDRMLVDWTDELTDFADTAALIENLDLVISVDSAVAHLAGALAKKIWVLVQFIPDWRWMLDRPDSPWYPTMRLFRQTIRGSWDEPVAEMVDALREFRT